MLKENFYLFLDIDGVLYDITWIKKEFDSGNISVRDLHTFKPESVSALNFLISKLQEKFNVDLVICSTWRINMKDTVCTLYKNGLKNFKEIHSTGFSFNEADREEEIFKYLQDKPNNQNIVIIDDESFNYKKYFPQSKIIKPSIYSNSLSFQMVNEFLINNQNNSRMNIGYVSIIMSEPGLKMKSCILKNASEENLIKLIKYNLEMLDKILDYNFKHNIFVFRISSGFIPFASHPINKTDWCKMFKKDFMALGEKAKKYGIRLSMHPGQYTTLTSPNKDVVKKSIWDLKYQTGVLDCMGLDSKNKIILHIGGKYENKKESMERFIKKYKKLPKNIKKRLVIENDDRNYTAEDVLYISSKADIPVLFDYFHHLLNHDGDLNTIEVLKRCMKTWKKDRDGIPKIHYSQQATDKKSGSHSLTIDVPEFLKFYNVLPCNVDIMLEVKDKDISASKCILATK